MNFKMTKVAAAVGVGLGTAVVGMNVAQSDEILFPYVVASDTVTTLISVMNTRGRGGAQTDEVLHYEYFFKRGTPPTNSASCEEVDFEVPTSKNDIISFDVSAHFGADAPARGVLFNDPGSEGSPGVVNAFYKNTDLAALAGTGAVRSFLMVDNNALPPGGTGTPSALVSGADRSIFGEAIILEFDNGAAWGYRAYNSRNFAAPTATPAGPGFLAGGADVGSFNFADSFTSDGVTAVFERTGDVLDSAEEASVAILPFDSFTTRFFVTPIAPFTPGVTGHQRHGNLSATIRLKAPITGVDGNVDAGTIFNTPNVIFDRDERVLSGQAAGTVVCVGALDATQLFSELVRQRVPDGGWSFVTVDPTGTGQAVVIKLEFNGGTEDIDGGNLNQVVNNAEWLREQEPGFTPTATVVP